MTGYASPPRAPRRPRRLEQVAALVLSACVLAACDSDQQELQAWMAQQLREVKPNVEPLAAPKKFNPVPYANAATVDPFSNQKLAVSLKQESRQPSSAYSVEFNRRKDPLESFPLDAMAMVGSLIKGGRPRALLKVDNLLYQIKPGDYLGQNYGRVTRITETEVTLREIVQDAAGEWMERSASLQLQESAR